MLREERFDVGTPEAAMAGREAEAPELAGVGVGDDRRCRNTEDVGDLLDREGPLFLGHAEEYRESLGFCQLSSFPQGLWNLGNLPNIPVHGQR